jgi:hypothetical protein
MLPLRAHNLLPALLMTWGLAACSPPTVRHRVDFVLQADGQCLVHAQAVPCAEAGSVAAAATPGGAATISAVLLISPEAPPTALQALRSGMQVAHIAHVQYGDSKHMSFERHAPMDI